MKSIGGHPIPAASLAEADQQGAVCRELNEELVASAVAALLYSQTGETDLAELILVRSVSNLKAQNANQLVMLVLWMVSQQVDAYLNRHGGTAKLIEMFEQGNLPCFCGGCDERRPVNTEEGN